MYMKNILFFGVICLFLVSCKTEQKPQPKTLGVISEKAMVVSAREEVSNIGNLILQKGGNAFDAMAGVELALAVAYPYAGSLGGGGFMVYRLEDGTIGSLDYREKAPLAATKKMYLDDDENVIPNKSTLGAMAVGIPGNLAGIFASHEKFGKLPMSEILAPVIELARKGVIVTEKQQKRLEKYREAFLKVNDSNFFLAKAWKATDTIKRIQLAKTLERIQLNGRDEFYKGESAQILVDFMQKSGGIMTMEDLANYEAKWRIPIIFSYDDLRVISMSPPSSGGICLAEIMKAIEPYDLDKLGHNTVKSIQLITEAERRAYADRSFFLGDPDFVKIPTDILLNENYIKERMGDFSFEKATPSSEVSHGEIIEIVESDETTHYCIVDQFGNAVSVTTTINGAYGSKLYCEELGFFLNNEMDDFSAKPGEPNMFGLIGAEANSIAPEKRMLSSMTPTIVEKKGKLFMVVGTPGGSTIITSVLQTILNVHEYDMGMQEAINQPRFHHQWLPDVIKMEPTGFSNTLKAELAVLGYRIDATNSPVIGKVEGILILSDGKLEGGADPRGDDKAVGF
jgi:gamma-glutamyltranspeptidase/glutathione hydrolase